jgi:hypothetical protein
MVHQQWAILDRTLHTFAFVRSRSAILLTTMLALGSTALATLPQNADQHVAEALRLHAHVEKLNLVVYTTGARSIEIIQAHIVNLSFRSGSGAANLDSFCRDGEFLPGLDLMNSVGCVPP